MKVHIVFDENNPFFQLLKSMGCDLSQEVMNRYDALLLGMSFIFAVVMICIFCKFFYNVRITHAIVICYLSEG